MDTRLACFLGTQSPGYLQETCMLFREISRRPAVVPKKAPISWVLLDTVGNELKGIQEITGRPPGGLLDTFLFAMGPVQINTSQEILSSPKICPKIYSVSGVEIDRKYSCGC